MSDHALLSPSSADRWMMCPGSVALSAGLPDDDSPYAREGTFAHDIAAACLRGGKPAASFIGHTNGEFTCDAVMAEHIQTYLDVVDAVMLSRGDALHVEVRVELSDEVYGTADAIVVAGETLYVFDFKYGAGKFVPAVDNAQALIYAIGALRTLDLTGGIRDVCVAIVQPRRTDADGNAHRSATYPIEFVRNFETTVLACAAATKLPDAELKPGDHCTFCRAKHACPKLREVALASAAEVFPKVGDLTTRVAPPLLETIPTERLVEIVNAAPAVKAWIDAVYAHLAERARREKIPGKKLVAKLGNRKWKLDIEATNVLRVSGIDPYTKPKLVSPAEAEKRLGSKRKALIEPLVERVVTGAVLVDDSDKRPALDRGAVFTIVQTEE